MLLTEVLAPQFVYHITQRNHISAIKSQGLIPQNSPWSHIKYPRPSTFVLPSRDEEYINEILSQLSNKHLEPNTTHDDWDNERWDQFNSLHVMLTIDVSKCPNVEFMRDPGAKTWMVCLVTYDVIPAAAIVHVEDVTIS